MADPLCPQEKTNGRQKLIQALDWVNGWRIAPRQTLVINGFWRSGTTWLQEMLAAALGAKPVFEPFMAPAGYVYDCLPEIRPGRSDRAFVQALMPFAQGPLPKGTALRRTLERALRGQLSRAHVSTIGGANRSLRSCLVPRVVVKLTRGALCLRAIADTIHGPILHIHRDPRAVIASLQEQGAASFADGAFRDFPLRAHLLDVQDGRRDYFSRWAADLDALERGADCGRLAAYHCLTEHFLADSFQGYAGPFASLGYEELLRGGAGVLEGALRRCGLAAGLDGSGRFRTPSATDFRHNLQGWSRGQSQYSARWQSLLSGRDRALVEEVVRHFGMEDRLRS